MKNKLEPKHSEKIKWKNLDEKSLEFFERIEEILAY